MSDIEKMRRANETLRMANESLHVFNEEMLEVLKDALPSLEYYYLASYPKWDGEAAPSSIIGRARTVLAKSEAARRGR